jgi:hypothetical protein
LSVCYIPQQRRCRLSLRKNGEKKKGRREGRREGKKGRKEAESIRGGKAKQSYPKIKRIAFVVFPFGQF